MPNEARWNHNIHYHRLVLSAVPAGARTALDAGCGEGMLARALRGKVPEVVGVDLHQPSIELAKDFADDISYVGMRTLARRLLPGVKYRRHILWRYSLTWQKPNEFERTGRSL